MPRGVSSSTARDAMGQVADRVADRLEAGRHRLDEIIAGARAGKTYRPSELLAMQAEVYRIGEEIALTHKLVQEGMSSVRRLWNLQV